MNQEPTNPNLIKSPKVDELRKRYFKTLGTSVINSPMSPPFTANYTHDKLYFTYLGSYSCSCPSGYQYRDGSCHDVDECLEQPCGQHGDCSNLPGSHQCFCHPGIV